MRIKGWEYIHLVFSPEKRGCLKSPILIKPELQISQTASILFVLICIFCVICVLLSEISTQITLKIQMLTDR